METPALEKMRPNNKEKNQGSKKKKWPYKLRCKLCASPSVHPDSKTFLRHLKEEHEVGEQKLSMLLRHGFLEAVKDEQDKPPVKYGKKKAK